jgi:SAM-dependent methyltransferase
VTGSQPVLLNLGCGRRRHPAWTNADLSPSTPEVLQVDVREPLPFGDAEFDAVYASHVLEHLSPSKGRALVREIRRILRPGGIVRLVVPDLETLCRNYLSELDKVGRGDTGADARHQWATIELLDQLARVRSGGLMLRWWRREPIPAEDLILERLGAEARDAIAWVRRRRSDGKDTALTSSDWIDELEPTAAEQIAFRQTGEVHRWMYDRVSMDRLLREAGFSETRVTSAHESRIPGWGEYLLDCDSGGRPHKPDSLFVEAGG